MKGEGRGRRRGKLREKGREGEGGVEGNCMEEGGKESEKKGRYIVQSSCGATSNELQHKPNVDLLTE